MFLKFEPINYLKKPKLRWNKMIFSYGIGLTKTRIINYTSINVDKILIGKIWNHSTLGVYERFYKVITLTELYTGRALDNVLFSLYSKLKKIVISF